MVTPNVVEITDVLRLRAAWEQAQVEAHQAHERLLAQPDGDARAVYRSARCHANATHAALAALASAEYRAARRL